MRYNLEQLKAMTDEQIQKLWADDKFPFDSASCHACLTMHISMKYCEQPNEHQGLHDQLVCFGLTPGKFIAKEARPHLEELYALRLFYDHLYPPQTQLPSGFAAQPDSSVGSIALPEDKLEAMVESWRDAESNT